MSEETTIPCLPCTSLKTVFDFYQILGFETTYQQKSPNEYAVLRRGGFHVVAHSLRMAKHLERLGLRMRAFRSERSQGRGVASGVSHPPRGGLDRGRMPSASATSSGSAGG